MTAKLLRLGKKRNEFLCFALDFSYLCGMNDAITLYHGSNAAVERPQILVSRTQRNRIPFVYGLLLYILTWVPLHCMGQQDDKPQQLRIVKVEAERLPDLNIPREGHAVFCAGGELMVAGGHTNGFVPTATAEYLSDGEWHQLPMTYTHDHGTALVLRSGQVLLAGGSKEEMGVGQTF